MTKVKVKISLYSSQDTIDLEDYGHSKKTKWSDLSIDEQNEIEDVIRLDNITLLNFEDLE